MKVQQSILAVGRPRLRPNLWDMLALALLFGAFVAVGEGGREALAPLTTIKSAWIFPWNPAALPDYALRTTPAHAGGDGGLAGSSPSSMPPRRPRAGGPELVLVPLLDILQSVPMLGFLSFTVISFLALFPGSVLGAECAAIFAIFTSQAWNMAFSFYQSLRTVPPDLEEVGRSFRFTAWQRFWRLEVPFAMPRPGLEHDDVDVRRLVLRRRLGGDHRRRHHHHACPASAPMSRPRHRPATNRRRRLGGAAMLAVILAYDQLLFRPLVAGADKFRIELTRGGVPRRSWLLRRELNTAAAPLVLRPSRSGLPVMAGLRLTAGRKSGGAPPSAGGRQVSRYAAVGAAYLDWRSALPSRRTGVERSRAGARLGAVTMLRVMVLIALASLLWVPVGVPSA